MGTTKGSRYDKAVIVYDLIMESQFPKMSLMYFLENADYIDSSEEKEVEAYFTAQQLKSLEKQYSDLVDAIINKLTLCHYKKEKFYEEVWEKVLNSDMLFDSKNVKIYALGRIWSDARIPYFWVKDGLKMSNEEFIAIIERKKELLQEANFILNCKYEQKTETGSLLLNILERCDDNKEKAVVMAGILDFLEKKVVLKVLWEQAPVSMILKCKL